MAITTINTATPTNLTVFTDTAMGAGLDAIKGSSALVYQALIDNTANAGAASYLKLFNVAAGSVTLGTTAPDEVIYVPAATKLTHLFYSAATPGKTFGTALTAACVTTGGTAGTTPPVSNVPVTITYV